MPPGVELLPWGRLSLFATSTSGVLCATGRPLPVTLPSLAFLTPSTVFSATGLVGLFHPTAASRVSLQGLILSHSRPQLVAEVVPSRRLTELRCPRLPTSSTSPGPALRAFSPCENPQPLLRCLAAASIRSPPGLSSSRFSFSMPWKRLHASCRSWPYRRPCRVIVTDDLQRSVTEPGLPLSRLPTCSRF
jgi:hypothetical protein